MLLLFYKYFENSSLDVFYDCVYGTGHVSSLRPRLGSVIEGQETRVAEGRFESTSDHSLGTLEKGKIKSLTLSAPPICLRLTVEEPALVDAKNVVT